MRRAYIITLIMLTLISAVACSTVAPPDGSPQSPAENEVQNTAQNEVPSGAVQSSSASDTAQSEPAAKEPQVEENPEPELEPEPEPEPKSTVPEIQPNITEPTETVADSNGTEAVSQAQDAEDSSAPSAAAAEASSPEPTLPDARPAGRRETDRFLMLSPQIEVSAVLPERITAAEPETIEPETIEPETIEPETIEPETIEPGADEEGSADDKPVENKSEQISRSQLKPQPEPQPQPEPEPDAEQAAQPQMDVIRAGKGEQVHLSLPGFGWIYDRGASQSSGVEFRSRSYAQSATEFVFSARDVGRYTLAFQQQDSSTGRSSVKRIAVEVSLQSVQDRIAAQAAGAEAGHSAESAGAGDAAAPGESPQPDLQLPSFSFERLESAVLARNTNSTAQQVQALLLSRGGGGNSDLQPAAAEEPVFTDAQRRMMVDAGELLFDSEREMLAEQVLELYLQEGGEQIGRVLYLLGQIYESPPPPRDERRSVEYYQRIVNFYPTDPYRRRAEERIRYLQRHFLQIR